MEKVKLNSNNIDVKIVTSEETIVEFAKLDYYFQFIGVNRRFLRKQICP